MSKGSNPFITGPKHVCPQCRKQELGTLHIANNVHHRRCGYCHHDQSEVLPSLAKKRFKKKLIYLDQMAISNMAKELDPVWRKEREDKGKCRDQFWLVAFDRIDRLRKLHVIACPYSSIHRRESVLTRDHEAALRHLYKYLAGGVAFRYWDEVWLMQLRVACKALADGVEPDWNAIARDDIVDGFLDRWADRIGVTAHLPLSSTETDKLRAGRDRAHDMVKDYWSQWKSEGSVSLTKRYRRERRALADAAMPCYAQYLRNVLSGAPRSPGPVARIVLGLLRPLTHKGMSSVEAVQEVHRFLHSEHALCAPQNEIRALFWASFAGRATSGQKPPRKPGTLNDVTFIAAYLPYCDAMFVDNECEQLLREGKLRDAVRDYPVKVFAKRSRQDFLGYLDELECLAREAEPDHFEFVAQTYGETWLQPNCSVLEHWRARQPCRGDT